MKCWQVIYQHSKSQEKRIAIGSQELVPHKEREMAEEKVQPYIGPGTITRAIASEIMKHYVSNVIAEEHMERI